MKKIFEFLKDLIYDSMDYIMMLGIVIIVTAIIGWRLDLLFAKDFTSKNPIISKDRDPIVKEEPVTVKEPPTSVPINDPDEIESQEPMEELPTDNQEEIGKEVNEEKNEPAKIVSVNIPAGASSSSIGQILEDHKLISSKDAFIQSSEDMGLSTKLKSGTYSIPENSSMEEVLKIITK